MERMTAVGRSWPGVEVRWAAQSADGAKTGSSVALEIAPGAGYPVAVLAAVEQVVYVCDGELLHRGSGGEMALGPDQTLTVTAGAAHGLENTGPEPAVVLASYTGASELPWDRMRPATEGADGAEVFRHSVHEVADDPYAVAENGFHEMLVSFLAAEGAKATTFGFGRWPQGEGQHMWHRHENADEIIYIFEGEAQHMTEAGTAILRPGDFAYVPAGEWHSMRSNDPTRPLDAIFGYLGGASLEQAGYELRH